METESTVLKIDASVIELMTDEQLKTYFSSYDGKLEKGHDEGGVVRDCLSEFWNDFYEQCTMGSSFKVPFLRHDFGQIHWESVGRIIAFGWQKEKYLPVKIALVILEQATFGIAKSNVIENFLKFVPESERAVFEAWRSDFNTVDNEELLEVLDGHSCRKTPTKDNAEEILQELAHKKLIQEPAYVIEQWATILPTAVSHLDEISSVYENLQPTVRKVLKSLSFPEDMNAQQREIQSAVKFLCVNELGLRGTAETLRPNEAGNDDIASGLFLKLMEYTLEKDEKLASIAKGIPKNAKYTSKDIQNEIIQTLADMVLRKSQSVDMCSASEVVGAALESLKNIRKDEYWAELSEAAAGDDSHLPKRRRTMSKHLGQSVVLSTVGHTDSDNPTLNPHQSLKRSLLNILDRAISEMETRFSQRNVDLMKAISSLAPKSSAFLDSTQLQPLTVLVGTVADNASLKNEILVAKQMLLKKSPNDADLSSVCKHLQQYKEAFPELHKLYVTVLVIGVSSAACESSFSTLSRF
ncbi:hypothetical protein ROHU_010634 [Labeo rohita]|uniref:HAT C-terminal dimerisation domain-containing protein n=1 Tax=Labeo rohita TaxID=84645 RepID=A0A498M248_LABRO|nr:hypothetical protein ROHU_010634 [Labeo rohita]